MAIDNRIEGRDLATTFPLKADLVIDSADPDAITKIKEWSGHGGLPALVCCTDNIAVSKWGLKLLRPHGTYVPLGLPVDDYTFDAFDLVFRELTIVGSLVATQKQAQEMLNAAGAHGIKSWITEIPLERAPELPELYMDQHLKGRLVVNISA